MIIYIVITASIIIFTEKENRKIVISLIVSVSLVFMNLFINIPLLNFTFFLLLILNLFYFLFFILYSKIISPSDYYLFADVDNEIWEDIKVNKTIVEEEESQGD